jgi:hypothetical protein
LPGPRLLAPLFLCAAFASARVAAEPLAREAVPEPLRPWVDWVLRGHESERCPFLNENGSRFCVWPGQLALDLSAGGGRFTQDLFVAAESEVALPGGDEHWPEDVRANGAAAPVFARDGRPTVRLARGTHRVSGRFVWSELPPLLGVPPETGLVSLRVAGAAVPFPRRDGAGRLWLRESETADAKREAEDHLEVEVHRRVVDEVPLRLETHVLLRVAGAARDETLGRALPDGFVPTRLSGPLPARLEPDGRLRVQLRPGTFGFEVTARHEGPASALVLPVQAEGARWDASEVWSVEARPELRLIEVEGAPAVDPSQTEMPEAWKPLPAYRIEPGGGLRLAEKRRGNEGGAADRLTLARTWHLDFDGGGATVADRIEGDLRATTRLEMGAATALGRANVNGADQPVTRRAGVTQLGVEVPLGPLSLEADSRVEGGVRRLAAVGWDHDFDALEASVQLPPGWRLLHASGVDRASPTWIASWTLLDLFVVMVVTMAVLRLFGPRAGALALAALALSYTEAGAPRWTWVAVLAAEALARAVPPGRLASAVRLFRLASLVTLVLIAIPFAVAQLRAGLFPALERPWQMATAPASPAAADEAAAPMPETVASAEGVLMRQSAAKQGPRSIAVDQLRSLGYVTAAQRYAGYAPDPDAKIQTGPGRPDWEWQRVALAWSGPVERGQELVLWLLPPWLAGALALLRVALLAALVLLVLGRLPRWPATPPAAMPMPSLRRFGVLLALASSGTLALAPAAARAELPTQELLEELRTRLLEAPACHPSCAKAARLGLAVTPERLELRLAVDVAAETAIPLPGGGSEAGAGFVPELVVLDGAAAEALLRDASGQLWLRLGPGRHTVGLSGRLPPRANVELPLPLRPERVELLAPPRGWALLGVHADGRVEGALQLVRDAAPAPGEGAEATRLEPTAIPSFVSVERTLALGTSWQVTTQVVRVAPPEGAIVLGVPLLPGESVTTPGIRVAEGRALVTLAPGAGAVGWASVLAPSASLALEAPREVAWSEVWRLDASPLWHVTADGIPAVDAPAAGRRLREWRPWPGETLRLAVERPEGGGGGTLTVDRSELSLSPGLRATDARLTLALRSSQGGQHFVTLPEGAELQELTLDGVVQPLRQEERRVPLALAPGAHRVGLAWREPRGISVFFPGPEVDLGLASVNAHVEFAVPEGRWVLFVGGPRLGPTVLFWPVLLVVAALAFALGRVPWTPLRARHWLLLGLGLTQAPLPAAALVAVWLLALGLRGRLSEGQRMRSPAAFDLLQIVLAGLTLAALVALLWAIQLGLLGTPVMQIAGNGSEYGALRWYQDRAGALLPRPWLFSLSLWFYRLAMLAWSLWVAQALVGWLRWGFRQWSAGGHWLPLRAPRAPHIDPPLPQSRQ